MTKTKLVNSCITLIKANLTNKCEAWEWSSSFYLQSNHTKLHFLNYNLALSFFNHDQSKFLEFINYDCAQDDLFDPLNMNHYVISKIKNLIDKYGDKDKAKLRSLYIYLLKEHTSLSYKEISQAYIKESITTMRKIYSRINLDKSAYSDEIKRISKKFKISHLSHILDRPRCDI